MYKSGVFNKEEMRNWEQKDKANKTWVHLRAYFGDMFDANEQYTGLTADSHGFVKAANNVCKARPDAFPALQPADMETYVNAMKELAIAATADKEHIQQMSSAAGNLLAIGKWQQATIEKLTAQNTQLIAQTTKLTEALAKLDIAVKGVPGPPHPPGKCNSSPRNRNYCGNRNQMGGEAQTDSKKKEEVGPHKCTVCPEGHPRSTWHLSDECLELNKNKDKPHIL
jgi:hypothetical protein